MSRLDYAPKLKEIQITSIKKGLGVFAPQPGKKVSFAALKETLKKAGYALDSADITVVGVVRRDGESWWLVAEPTGQRFALDGADVEKILAGLTEGARVELTGDWKTAGEGDSARETIRPRAVKKPGAATKTARATGSSPDERTISESSSTEESPVTFSTASFDAEAPRQWLAVPLADTLPSETSKKIVAASKSDSSSRASKSDSLSRAPSSFDSSPKSSTILAPIRTTSPGLTVYKGGAVTPRLYLVEQHLGGLSVSRQIFNLGVSYTPSPRVQLEVEVPVSRTSFDDGAKEGSGAGLGNVTLWGKYRFYRTLKTYGDRQAAVRVGLELPTGRKTAPTASEVNAPAFVRQQLTPISGGFAPHLDLAFSQAGGRFIFGGDAEGVLRTERDGFRMGHELRVNTDLEYVLLPFRYESPGHELFLVLETSFVHRGTGRLGGLAVPGSKATEFYVEPGLQYAAAPRFVIEGSVQFPLVRNTGALMLRTDRNILVGVRYLF
ncbi:MAG: hypothetical protein LC785_06360 [Acidobacteria bacterium]|nr:hypothetical protein [Acidobacteriota bacterium]MCA1641567.1 hypothetical protein [Acidobacteriota bacterium]